MRPISALGLIAIIGCRTEPEKVVNVAPVFTSIVIVPDSNITSSTELLCVANAIDENNDQLLLDYQWTKTDGSVIGEFDRLQLSPDIVDKEVPVLPQSVMIQRALPHLLRSSGQFCPNHQ